jgi:ketosteroid isomerase-like protein
MKQFLVVTLLAVAMPLLAFGQATSTKADGETEAEIMKMEDQWVQSRAAKDPTVTESLLADDLLGAGPNGQALTKQQYIDLVMAGNFATGKAEQSDRKVRIYGDTAISTGVVTGVGPKGTDKVRYLRVYVKSNNKWKLVALQGSRVVDNQ